MVLTKPRKNVVAPTAVLPRRSSALLRLNSLAPYYTMFPLQFPFDALRHAQIGDSVLDPFCGRGTTLFAARLRGVTAIGIDSNPVAAAIAAAKLVSTSAPAVVKLAKRILDTKTKSTEYAVPTGEFWSRCFGAQTLADICRIRGYLLRSCKKEEEIALRGVMLGILHGPRNKGVPTYLSNQMPRTYSTKPIPAIRYWKKNRLYAQEVDVIEAIARRAVFSFQELPPKTTGNVVCGDSREITGTVSKMPISWIVTSPPYYGMRTYFPDHWLRNWFVGGPSDVQYEQNKQLSHAGEQSFIADLARVWRRSASICMPGAKMICRFGAIPSALKDPRYIMRTSLNDAKCGWRIKTIRCAGDSSSGRRQSDQFCLPQSAAIDEIDVYATLES